MKNKRLAAVYVLPFGFLISRALIDGETPIERLALVAVVIFVALAMYPLSKRLYEPLQRWFSKQRQYCPECNGNMSVKYQICPHCKLPL